MRTTTTRPVTVIAALALVAAACGGGEPAELLPQDSPIEAAQTAPTMVPAVAPMDTVPPTSGTPRADAPLPTVPATTETPSSVVTTEPPPETTTTTGPDTPTTAAALSWGEPYDDLYGLAAGEEIFVIGVRHDDVLNVRAGPGTEHATVTTLHPWGSATVTGKSRILANGAVWHEVTANGATGWAHRAYLSRMSSWETDEWIMAQLGDASAPTMLELGEMVTGIYQQSQSEDPPTVELTLAPRFGDDGGELGYDVIGFYDDSELGARVHIFVSTTETGDYYVVDIQVRSMCWRGVSEGLCV
jgi:hypothetical protein